MSLFLSHIFLQREIKHWAFKTYLLAKETSSWFLLIGSLCKSDPISTYARALCTWVLNFYQRGFASSSRHVLPKLSKITVTCPKAVKKWIRSILTCPTLAKQLSTLNFSKSAKWLVWKSIYISPVTEKLETSNLDTR